MTTNENSNDAENQLLSYERLDRSSPEIWRESIPGVNEFAAKKPNVVESPVAKWMTNLDDNDMNLLQEMGCMSTAQIMEKVNDLHNLSYSLGLEEAREMTRGKFLNIFPKQHK